MRILIFHGYLLGGTGSNVYTARLAAALAGLGHEVHLLCQDRHPERQPFVRAAGDWDAGSLRVRSLGLGEGACADGAPPPDLAAEGAEIVETAETAPVLAEQTGAKGEGGRCTVYRPDIGSLLPVYVADRYEGIEARAFADCTDAEIARYIEANVAAVSELAARARPEIALANHLVMGPVILARGLGGEVPYAVKVHGSALEYTVKTSPERFLGLAREGLAGARAILVGSRHTALSLWQALGDETLEQRTRLGPPGVDVQRFLPREPSCAREGLRALADRVRAGAGKPVLAGASGDAPGRSLAGRSRAAQDVRETGAPAEKDAFARDDLAAAAALSSLDPQRERLVAFVGKLILNKGVDLLLAAWPLVLAREPRATLVVVGFGADRALLERLLGALSKGDLGWVQEIALPHLAAFVRTLRDDARTAYLAAAQTLPERVVLTGRLDHEELVDLVPACEALIVPSTFPEAFGMVAAEAAACGVLPISAAHSGLAEVSDALAPALPAQVAALLSFPVDDDSVRAIAERILAWLQVESALREQTRAGLVATARERWSWQGVARGVIAAARGELDALPAP
jgi:glycosyltransferase involved in cell wall biosynthesis